MAAHLRPLAPSSTLDARNLIASPSPTHAISSDDVVMCRRVSPFTSTLVEMAVRVEWWMARLVLRASGAGRGVFMPRSLPKSLQKTYSN